MPSHVIREMINERASAVSDASSSVVSGKISAWAAPAAPPPWRWLLTRALLGYFFITQVTGGLFLPPPPFDLGIYWSDFQISSGVINFRKICRGKSSFIDLGHADDVTGQVKDKMLSHFSDSMNDHFPDQNIDSGRISCLWIDMMWVSNNPVYHFELSVTSGQVKFILGQVNCEIWVI